jgi:hypothetical protein
MASAATGLSNVAGVAPDSNNSGAIEAIRGAPKSSRAWKHVQRKCVRIDKNGSQQGTKPPFLLCRKSSLVSRPASSAASQASSSAYKVRLAQRQALLRAKAEAKSELDVKIEAKQASNPQLYH